MAVSGSWDFIQTRDDIIKSALRKVGAVAQGEDPSANQMAEAAHALNSLNLSLMNDGVYLWTYVDNTLALSDGVASYTLDAKVIGILPTPYIRVNDYDFPVSVITKAEYDSITTKAMKARPERVYFERKLDASYLYFHYTPDTSYTFYYTAVLRLQDLNTAADNPDFPVEWSNALIFGSAHIISYEYGLDLKERQLLKLEANDWLSRALAASKEGGSLYIALLRR
jgi:hypothetical protein